MHECLLSVWLLSPRIKGLDPKLFAYPLKHHTVFFITEISQTTICKIKKIQEKKLMKNKTLIKGKILIIKIPWCHMKYARESAMDSRHHTMVEN